MHKVATDLIDLVLGKYSTVDIDEVLEIEEKFVEWSSAKQREFEKDVYNQIPLSELGEKYDLEFSPAAFEDEPYPVGTELQDVLPKDVECVCITWHRRGHKQDKRMLIDKKEDLDKFTNFFAGASILRRDMFEKGLPRNWYSVEIMLSTSVISEFRVSGYIEALENRGFVGKSTKECRQMLREFAEKGEEVDSFTTDLLKHLIAKQEATRLLARTLAAVRDVK